ncbi:hypothetical protein HK100_011552 [Physocladia obscura]|uniref:PH domain-containing protein n=1 Tax=Physocladia obscura TaxID=109957 RepID=A0AAD5XD59_9FUNG|nr:hypothetical protein HK100_011552 [Physocladia obscura]
MERSNSLRRNGSVRRNKTAVKTEIFQMLDGLLDSIAYDLESLGENSSANIADDDSTRRKQTLTPPIEIATETGNEFSTVMAEKPLMNGFLSKQFRTSGEGGIQWKSRFLVLRRDRRLLVYRSTTNPLAQPQASLVPRSAIGLYDEAANAWLLVVVSDDNCRKWTLRCEDISEILLWTDAINSISRDDGSSSVGSFESPGAPSLSSPTTTSVSDAASGSSAVYSPRPYTHRELPPIRSREKSPVGEFANTRSAALSSSNSRFGGFSSSNSRFLDDSYFDNAPPPVPQIPSEVFFMKAAVGNGNISPASRPVPVRQMNRKFYTKKSDNF